MAVCENFGDPKVWTQIGRPISAHNFQARVVEVGIAVDVGAAQAGVVKSSTSLRLRHVRSWLKLEMCSSNKKMHKQKHFQMVNGQSQVRRLRFARKLMEDFAVRDILRTIFFSTNFALHRISCFFFFFNLYNHLGFFSNWECPVVGLLCVALQFCQ